MIHAWVLWDIHSIQMALYKNSSFPFLSITTLVDAAYRERPSRLSVFLSVGHLVSPAENSEAIEIPFAFWTRVGPGKDLLHIADLFGWILYCVHSTQYSFLVYDGFHALTLQGLVIFDLCPSAVCHYIYLYQVRIKICTTFQTHD